MTSFIENKLNKLMRVIEMDYSKEFDAKSPSRNKLYENEMHDHPLSSATIDALVNLYTEYCEGSDLS